MVERSADWIAQAKRDLDNAKYEIEGKYFEWACFLSQQSAEKAVKAVYHKLGGEPFGHSVTGLLARLPPELQEKTQDRKISGEILNAAKELDKAYIAVRYPNAHPEGAPYNFFTETEARRLVSHAERILRFCEDLLSGV